MSCKSYHFVRSLSLVRINKFKQINIRRSEPGLGLVLVVLRIVKDVGEATLSAVLTVVVGGHEDAGPALLGRTLAPQTVDLLVVHLVVLQDGQLHILVLVWDLLGGRVVLLLPLLGSSPQPQHQVEGGLLLDVVVGQSPPVLQLLPGKDQSLLIRWDSFLILDLGFYILDGITGLHLQGDGLPRQGLHKDLHVEASTAGTGLNYLELKDMLACFARFIKPH